MLLREHMDIDSAAIVTQLKLRKVAGSRSDTKREALRNQFNKRKQKDDEQMKHNEEDGIA